MGKTKKETALWAVLTQGGLVSLAVYFVGLLGLSALVTEGTVGEGSAFIGVLVLCALSSFLGGLVTVRRTPWGGATAGLVTAAVFAGALAMAGLGCWGSLALPGRAIALTAGALAGGLGAGVLGGRKRGKRARRRKPSPLSL